MLVLKYLPDGLILAEPETATEFESLFELRWAVLRKPWNQAKGSEQDDEENDGVHRCLVKTDDNNKLIACGRIHSPQKGLAQIRYMAVDPEYRGMGFGLQVLRSLEEAASVLRCREIILNAREPAVDFYLKAGYNLLEETLPFLGIRHFRMGKSGL